ncbi:MAG: hypothetical protein ACLRJV_18045 [Eubacteriales bacterium]
MKFIGRRRELNPLKPRIKQTAALLLSMADGAWEKRRLSKSSSKTSSLFTFSQQRK